MASEAVPPETARRLHPTTLLFSIGRSLKNLVIPAVLALVGGRGSVWEWIFVVSFGVATVLAVIRYITLTHSDNNHICDSSYATERRWNGLSPFGVEVVAEMNRLGIMIDVSHVSDASFDQILEHTSAPVIASHSSCRAFTPGFERNLDDARIARLAENGGVIQINFGSAFLTAEANAASIAMWLEVGAWVREHDLDWSAPEAEAHRRAYLEQHPIPSTSVTDVADQIDHVVALVGIDHVGLGSDFDGVSNVPDGLSDVSQYPGLVAELLRRGYSEDDVRKVLGENILRVWEEVERVGAAS